MARVTRIDILVGTGNITHTGNSTNGFVFAGVGGREFVLDTVGNDFQLGSTLTYVIGEGTNLKRGGDPEEQIIDTADVLAFPAYIRFEPKGALDKWEITITTITVNPSQENIRFIRPYPPASMIMGNDSGKYLFLRRET